MKSVLAACALLVLANPAFANAPDQSTKQLSHELAGTSLYDRQGRKVGRVEYVTTINDKQAAVLVVDGVDGNNELALPIGDLRPGHHGVRVPFYENELVAFPSYAPDAPYALTAVK